MSWTQAFDRRIAAQLPGLKVLSDEPMSGYTSFRVGGPARRLALPATAEELTVLLELAETEKWPVLVIGNGSNLLVCDEGLDRLVIRTCGVEDIKLLDGTRLRAYAGTSLARLAVFAQKHGLTGLEFAHGIPGSLGGAVVMNAGAYGGEMCQVIESVTAWFPDRGIVTVPLQQLDLSYRHSMFSEGCGVVICADLALKEGDGEAIAAAMAELIAKRRDKQPLEYPSAGSTFKRPAGHFAGALIEQCGLKGFRIGGAQVSEKHAGFVINAGGATCGDILALMEHVQRVVKEQTGVELEPEVRYIGQQQ